MLVFKVLVMFVAAFLFLFSLLLINVDQVNTAAAQALAL